MFLGNEASDADSIVSSICMAFLKQQTLPEDAHWCAPWVQCKRGELKVRAETDALLRRAGLDPDWLVYQDEWQLPESPEEAGTAVAINLLDHNAMSPGVSRNLPWAPSAVEGIWDHHEDHGLHKVSDGTAEGKHAGALRPPPRPCRSRRVRPVVRRAR